MQGIFRVPLLITRSPEMGEESTRELVRLAWAVIWPGNVCACRMLEWSKHA